MFGFLGDAFKTNVFVPAKSGCKCVKPVFTSLTTTTNIGNPSLIHIKSLSEECNRCGSGKAWHGPILHSTEHFVCVSQRKSCDSHPRDVNFVVEEILRCSVTQQCEAQCLLISSKNRTILTFSCHPAGLAMMNKGRQTSWIPNNY